MWFWPLSPRHFHSWRGAKGLSPWPWWHYSINEYYMVTLFLDTWIKAVLWIWSCIILLQKNHRFLVNATTLVFCFLASLPLTYIFFLQTFSLLQIAQCCLMDCTSESVEHQNLQHLSAAPPSEWWRKDAHKAQCFAPLSETEETSQIVSFYTLLSCPEVPNRKGTSNIVGKLHGETNGQILHALWIRNITKSW